MSELQPINRLGKISEHARGAGVPSPEDVEQRARELAVIAGRAGSDFSPADLEQAKLELLGVEVAPADETTSVASVTEWDEVPGSSGTQAPKHGPQDEANVAEELVEQGVDEALHDEMLEARKKNID